MYNYCCCSLCKLLLSHVKNVKKYTLLYIRSIALSLNSIVVCDTKCRYTTLYLTHLTQFQHSSSCQYFLFSIYHYFPFFTWVYLKPEGRGVPEHFCNFIISSLLIGLLSSFQFQIWRFSREEGKVCMLCRQNEKNFWLKKVGPFFCIWFVLGVSPPYQIGTLPMEVQQGSGLSCTVQSLLSGM